MCTTRPDAQCDNNKVIFRQHWWSETRETCGCATIETRRRRTDGARDSSAVDIVVGAILFDRLRRAVGRCRRRHDGRRRGTGGRRHGNGRRPGGPAVAGRRRLRHLRDRRR